MVRFPQFKKWISCWPIAFNIFRVIFSIIWVIVTSQWHFSNYDCFVFCLFLSIKHLLKVQFWLFKVHSSCYTAEYYPFSLQLSDVMGHKGCIAYPYFFLQLWKNQQYISQLPMDHFLRFKWSNSCLLISLNIFDGQNISKKVTVTSQWHS